MKSNKKKEILKNSTVPHYEMIEKTVSKSGHNGRLYTPISWVGCRVTMLRIDPIEENEE